MSEHCPDCSAKAFNDGFNRGLEVGHRTGYLEACEASVRTIGKMGLDCTCHWVPEDLAARAKAIYVERILAKAYGADRRERAELEEEWGAVWDEAQLVEVFDVLGFMLPFVIVRRRSDGVRGAVRAQGRLYYDWRAD